VATVRVCSRIRWLPRQRGGTSCTSPDKHAGPGHRAPCTAGPALRWRGTGAGSACCFVGRDRRPTDRAGRSRRGTCRNGAVPSHRYRRSGRLPARLEEPGHPDHRVHRQPGPGSHGVSLVRPRRDRGHRPRSVAPGGARLRAAPQRQDAPRRGGVGRAGRGVARRGQRRSAERPGPGPGNPQPRPRLVHPARMGLEAESHRGCSRTGIPTSTARDGRSVGLVSPRGRSGGNVAV
jgi:hypothetical protein